MSDTNQIGGDADVIDLNAERARRKADKPVDPGVQEAVDAIRSHLGDAIAREFRSYDQVINWEHIIWQELSWRVFQRVCRTDFWVPSGAIYGRNWMVNEWECIVLIAHPDKGTIDTKRCSEELGQKIVDQINGKWLLLAWIVTAKQPTFHIDWFEYFMQDETIQTPEIAYG